MKDLREKSAWFGNFTRKMAGRIAALGERGGQWLTIALDAVFPRSSLAVRIEAMSRDEFAAVATPNFPAAMGGASDSSEVRDIYSIFPYRNPYVREAIWQIKYKRNTKIARLMGEFLTEALEKVVGENNGGNFIVLPIPISAERRKERGYNQIELILEQTPRPFRTDILRKIKNTTPQTVAQTRAERLKNLSGCFEVANPSAVAGKTVIIIDDVITTGTTLAEARKTLLSAGAKRVITIALAH